MSYDVDVVMDAGGPEPMACGDLNYTYNCAKLFRIGLVEAGGLDTGLSQCDGMKAAEAARLVRVAVAYLVAHPELKNLDPENGWGGYDSAVPWLESVAELCESHPLATVRVS